MSTLINFALVFFHSAKLYHAHHDNIGGAVLIGVDGVCVISHGSSGALAIFSAVQRAIECVEAGLVERMKEAIADAG